MRKKNKDNKKNKDKNKNEHENKNEDKNKNEDEDDVSESMLPITWACTGGRHRRR